MINSSEFIRKIEVIDVSSYNQFNWFKVMYKMTEERTLHSRMIAFLLNPEGSHNQSALFLKLFFEEFGILDFDLDKVKVYPEEDKKKEEDNIDILITNAKKQAIIIENKIFANDSNNEIILENVIGNCTHKYQIPRYYYKTQCKGYTVTHIYYLTIRNNKPSFYEDFPQEVQALLQCKDYIQSILNWMGKCIAFYPTEDAFKIGLQHYKQATTEFLNDMHLALQLKDISSQHLKEAFNFWIKKQSPSSDKFHIIQNQFIHVKWHTVHEFFTELARGINEEFKVDVTEVGNEKITAVTHRNTETPTLLTFKFQDVLYYICNDKNGFSIGRHIENKTEDDFQILFDKNYAFFNFSQPEVFQLIKPNESEKLAGEIVNALKNFIKNNEKQAQH